jgi:uncharacterized membrane protein HdeD (DUF308 family)
MPKPTPMPMCPMAEACKGMMKKPLSSVTLILPGVVFIALGIVIVLEPRILAWLIAIAFILIGIMSFMMARFVRRIGTQFGNMLE